MLSELYMWLLPSGWLAALASWFVSRKRIKVQQMRESNEDLLDAAKACRRELSSVHEEIIDLYEKIRIYNKAMAAAGSCGNGLDCPVIVSLQESGFCHKFRGQTRAANVQESSDQGEIS